jgi:hypothetical protein
MVLRMHGILPRAGDRRVAVVVPAPIRVRATPRASSPGPPDTPLPPAGGVGTDWARIIPVVEVRVAYPVIVRIGTGPVAVAVALTLHAVRRCAITGRCRRYVASRAIRTSRLGQFLFAVRGGAGEDATPGLNTHRSQMLIWALGPRRYLAVTRPADPVAGAGV